MGLTSERERSEFEKLCLQYPELVAARNEFEESLETLKKKGDLFQPKSGFIQLI